MHLGDASDPGGLDGAGSACRAGLSLASDRGCCTWSAPDPWAPHARCELESVFRPEPALPFSWFLPRDVLNTASVFAWATGSKCRRGVASTAGVHPSVLSRLKRRASVAGLSTKYVWLVNKVSIQAKFLYHSLETEFLLWSWSVFFILKPLID